MDSPVTNPLAEPEVVVAGLSMQMPISPSKNGIGGPAIYAAVGVRHSPVKTSLLTAVAANLPLADEDVLSRLDCATRPLRVRFNRPMISWSSPAILGNRGQGSLSDDPSRWRALPDKSLILQSQMLLLANGDPQWFAELLEHWKPPLVFMDVHIAWLQVREKALKKCMERSHILTMTEHEYRTLPIAIRSSGILKADQRLLVVKRGKHGVSIIYRENCVNLPAPAPAVLGTDVGCGDLLIGLLAGAFLHGLRESPKESWLDLITQAYLASLDPLRQLIESTYSAAFVRQRLTEIT